eukprot:Nk52_evm19s1020 gene=Nk52_evmTU19s1020
MSVILDSFISMFASSEKVAEEGVKTSTRVTRSARRKILERESSNMHTPNELKGLNSVESMQLQEQRQSKRVISFSSVDSGFVSPSMSVDAVDTIGQGKEKRRKVVAEVTRKYNLRSRAKRTHITRGKNSRKTSCVSRASITEIVERSVECGKSIHLKSTLVSKKIAEDLQKANARSGKALGYRVPKLWAKAKPCVADLWEDMVDVHAKYQPKMWLREYAKIDEHFRSAVLRYLDEVICKPNRVSPSAFHLAVNYIDRFMDLTARLHDKDGRKRRGYHKQFLLIAVTSLFSACKFEEVNPPSLSYYTNCADFFRICPEFVEVCNHKAPELADGENRDVMYTDKKIYMMEKHMLEILEWEMRPVTSVGWIETHLSNTSFINFEHNSNDRWNELKRDDYSIFRTMPRKTSISVDSGYNSSDGEALEKSLSLPLKMCTETMDSEQCYCGQLEKFYRPCIELLKRLVVEDGAMYLSFTYSELASTALYLCVAQGQYDPFVRIRKERSGFDFNSKLPKSCPWIEHITGHEFAELKQCAEWMLQVTPESFFKFGERQ